MKTLSCLDEVTQVLDVHENSLRIKKLIFCACKNAWENDPNKLNNFQLSELIKELIELNPTIENLKISLSKVVKSLNKQAEYAVLASLAFNQLQKLYRDSANLTQTVSTSPSTYVDSTVQSNAQPSLSNQSEPSGLKLPSEYNSFELRQEIMKYTNPLRAKVLIFSTLHGNFSYNEQDWSALREYQLDDLLAMLLQACQSLKDFENKLTRTAKSLQNRYENNQAVSVIMQTIRRYHPALESQVNQVNVDSSNIISSTSDDDEDSNTCQLFPPKDVFKNT